MTISFDITARERRTIAAIVKRAMKMAEEAGHPRDCKDMQMNLAATHCNGNPLRLDDLLQADDFNLAHDVFGIERHLDRTTGKLTDCFVPRFSAR